MSGDNDNFCGYLPEDLERVARLIPTGISSDPQAFTDAFGVKVDPLYCSWIAGLIGTVQTRLPFPFDGYLADGIEFAAAAIALERASAKKSFTAVELGAGWGPWTSFMGICAARMGFETISLTAFEADEDRFEFLRKHLTLNGLLPPGAPDVISSGRFKIALHRAAAWWRNERLYWPVVAGGMDAGLAAVSGSQPDIDYRGTRQNFRAVEGRAIQDIATDGPIDFLHIDIQGSEWELVSNSIGFLNEKVRSMFIGTHSRKIEGDLIELCNQQGWTLLREKPCQFYNQAKAPTLAGLTYHDGGQFWINDHAAVNADF